MVSWVWGWDLKTALGGGGGGKHYHTVALRQVLPVVDCIAGTGVMLWRFLEGRDERLP
jgi:hypothetical protein